MPTSNKTFSFSHINQNVGYSMKRKQIKILFLVALFSGSADLDQVLGVLLSTAMFVGGILGLILDNTIPGIEIQALNKIIGK